MPHVFERALVQTNSLPCFPGGTRPCSNTCPCFRACIRPWTNTCPMFLTGYSPVNEFTCPMFLTAYSSMDEYLTRLLERVFIRRTNTCPIFLRGYSSIDEYLPHKPNTKPTNTNTYSCSYLCGVCKVELKPFNLSSSQVTFFLFS